MGLLEPRGPWKSLEIEKGGGGAGERLAHEHVCLHMYIHMYIYIYM